jgi:hypothetical protein
MKYVVTFITFLIASASVCAQEAPQEQAKTLSGMSVLGNNEAPKALVIVPWKSSQIGDGIGVVESLSNRPMPVDRDVFGRELDYYYIRSGDTSPDGVAGQALDIGAR